MHLILAALILVAPVDLVRFDVLAENSILARDDEFQVNEDTVLEVEPPGVLANDAFNVSGTPVAHLATPPAHGSVELQAAGGFRYWPRTNFFGNDSFSYRVAAPGTTSMPALVRLTVLPVNDPPWAGPSSAMTDEDQGAVIQLDGDALRYAILTPPRKGWIFLNSASGVAEYRPFPDLSGEDEFTWNVSDGVLDSAPATVRVTIRPVADTPLARPDEWFVLAHRAAEIPAWNGVLANDYDGEGETLTAVLTDGPGQGTLELRPDGSFKYTPNPGFAGRDQFRYQARAGTRTSDPAEVVLRVGDERWADRFAGSAMHSAVFAMLPGPGPGQLIAGGAFAGQLADFKARGVALWNGTGWQTLGNGPFNGVFGNVRALSWFGGSLYAGGEMREAGGRAALNIARWDGGQWQAAGEGLNEVVFALTANETNLFAGGQFTVAGGQLARGVARWDGTNWFALGAGVEGAVESLAWSPSGDLLAAANVVSNNNTAGRVLRWDGITWTPLGDPFDGPVRALAFFEGDLVAAGRFARAGSLDRANVARWNGSAWSAMASGVPVELGSLTVHGQRLYAGQVNAFEGFFSPAAIYNWDGQTWTALPRSLQAESYSRVLALASVGDVLYAGGVFTRAGAAVVEHVAGWNGVDWQGLTRAVAGGQVMAIDVSTMNVFAAGTFASVAGKPARRLARWDGANWFALGSSDNNGANGAVHALAAHSDTELFIGGEFTEAGGKPARNVSRWDGTSWNALGSGVEGVVHALALDGQDALFAGGEFQSAGGQAVRHLARWNGTAWTEPGGGVDGPVFALARTGRGMVAAGAFQNAGGMEARCIALWDGSRWHALGGGISSSTGSQVVYALAVRGNEIFAGGEFTMAGGEPVQHVARWDGQRWHALAAAVTRPGWITSVRALSASGGSVFAGGVFTSIDGVPAPAIAQWNGAAWSGLGSGVEGNDERVLALAARGDQLFVGGAFAQAGGRSSRNFGLWSLPNSPPEVRITRPLNGSVFLTGDDITLQAQADDPDGSVRRVDFYAGNLVVGSAATAPFEVLWRNVFAGEYDLVAVAEDDQGERSSSMSIRVDVRPPAHNQPPTVLLTRPSAGAVFTLGEVIELTAQASDPDGSVREVRFFKDDQLLGVLQEPPFILNWTNVATGIFHLSAAAQDNLGAVATSPPVTVRVQSPPTVYLSSPSDGSVFGLPARVDLVADARDMEGAIARVDFLTNGVFFATATVYSSPNAYYWWENPPVGEYAISAIAFDEDGASSTAEPVNITVLPVNRPPSVTLLSPAGDARFGLPTNVVLRAEADDPDGFVREVQFWDGGIELARLTQRPYIYVLRNLVPGTYDLQARAVDDRGEIAFSSVARITTTNDPARVPKYELVDLGTLGGDGSYAFGVNRRDEVAGQAMRTDRHEHAFLYRDGKMIDLGTLSGRADDSSQALHINAHGWITGSSYDGRTGENRIFLFKGTNMTDLGTLGGRYNVTFRINDQGQIAGACSDPGDRFRAIVYTDGKLQQITGEGRESFAYGLNNHGAVVGKIEGFDGIIRAFRYDPTHGVRSLEGFNEDYSEARGINDSGYIAGKLSGARGWEAFLWSGGYVVELGSLGGGMSEAYALNNHNQVVGRSLDKRGPMAAFLWHGAVMHNLNALIAPDPRWHLTIAYDINDAGTIVGEGEWTSPPNATQRRAFLLRLAPDSPVRPEDNRFLQVVDGEFSAIVPVLRGQSLVIEATSDFLRWQPVSTNYNRTGVVDFTDPESRRAAQRFYRIQPAQH